MILPHVHILRGYVSSQSVINTRKNMRRTKVNLTASESPECFKSVECPDHSWLFSDGAATVVDCHIEMTLLFFCRLFARVTCYVSIVIYNSRIISMRVSVPWVSIRYDNRATRNQDNESRNQDEGSKTSRRASNAFYIFICVKLLIIQLVSDFH